LHVVEAVGEREREGKGEIEIEIEREKEIAGARAVERKRERYWKREVERKREKGMMAAERDRGGDLEVVEAVSGEDADLLDVLQPYFAHSKLLVVAKTNTGYKTSVKEALQDGGNVVPPRRVNKHERVAPSQTFDCVLYMLIVVELRLVVLEKVALPLLSRQQRRKAPSIWHFVQIDPPNFVPCCRQALDGRVGDCIGE